MGICAASLGILVATILVVVVGSLLPPPWNESVLLGSGFVGLCACGVALWGAMNLSNANRSERDAGYTTLFGHRWELWQLDARTGEVVRRPGERQVRRRPRDEA
jgi:hypothetical protein